MTEKKDALDDLLSNPFGELEPADGQIAEVKTETAERPKRLLDVLPPKCGVTD